MIFDKPSVVTGVRLKLSLFLSTAKRTPLFIWLNSPICQRFNLFFEARTVNTYSIINAISYIRNELAINVVSK